VANKNRAQHENRFNGFYCGFRIKTMNLKWLKPFLLNQHSHKPMVETMGKHAQQAMGNNQWATMGNQNNLCKHTMAD
jgi:hypothetical protein